MLLVSPKSKNSTNVQKSSLLNLMDSGEVYTYRENIGPEGRDC